MPGIKLGQFVVLILGASLSGSSGSKVSGDDSIEFFESKIRPLLIEHCYECHSIEGGESAGDLLLDSASGLRRGGAHGPAFIPGEPDKSVLMRAVGYEDSDFQMPPTGKLDADQTELLRRWIEIGAPDPREPTADSDTPIEKDAHLSRDPASHWAFVPPKRSVPNTTDTKSRDAIDEFASGAAVAKGIAVNSPATDETLVRRLYFDLTGMPPTAEDVEEYLRSTRPDRYTRLVDRLLATPDFGERFARHWMDVARYADTVGYALGGKERRFKGSDRYRDWTIHVLASDMPYDQMILHQLAGDRTDPNNRSGNLDAMGFLTLGRRFLNPLDVIDDRIDVITRGLLGMTVACARCHDHKFDPIPTSDYYAMAGIIHSSEQPDEGASPLMMVDRKRPFDSPVLIRGQPGNKGPIAKRQFLTSLRKEAEPRFSDGSGRWELAQRIIANDNPLTARVMTNRLWSILVGKPLVDSPSDFGFRTNAPAVPEVLDDLASDFAKHWSIKKTIRRIVLTRIYRQSAVASKRTIELDPENFFLARANRRRRDFESLRDSLLNAADSLDRTLGGDPVEITLQSPTPRRTVYAMIDRQNLPSLFRTFDFASPDTHSPGRYFTTVPQQALFMMNNEQMVTLVRRTSEVVRNRWGDDPTKQAEGMFRQVLGRKPQSQELSSAVEFLCSRPEALEPDSDPRSLWSYGMTSTNGEQAVLAFEPFAVFLGDRWQAAKKFPTPAPAGHAFLDRENGHAPEDTGFAVVRRFTAPFSGMVRLQGRMGHRGEHGDGVRVSIWVGGKRIFQEKQKQNDRPLGPFKAKLQQGETIDFVVAAGESDSYDSFFLKTTLALSSHDRRIETDSAKHFHGPIDPRSNEPLDRLAQFAQVLLMSNEFAFVD